MAPALDVPVVKSSVLDFVLTLVHDRIPNIRFNVAKALEVLATTLAQQPGGKELVSEGIMPALATLRDDKDADVRFFATKATEAAQAAIGAEASSQQQQDVTMAEA